MPEPGDKYRQFGKSGVLKFVEEITKNDKTWWEFIDDDRKRRSLYPQEVVAVKGRSGQRKRSNVLPAALARDTYGEPVVLTDSSGSQVTVR